MFSFITRAFVTFNNFKPSLIFARMDMCLPLDWVTICPEGQYYDSFYSRNYFPSTVSYIVDTVTDYLAYCNRELITTVLLNAVAGGKVP